MDKSVALREIQTALTAASGSLGVTSAPMARLAVPAAGLPFAEPVVGDPASAPKLGTPRFPLRDLSDLRLPKALALAKEAAPVAEAAPKVARSLSVFQSVPT